MLIAIEANAWFSELSIQDKHSLLLAAFFHDAVYKPLEKNNEDASIDLFRHAYKANNNIIEHQVIKLIECTKYRKRPSNRLARIFWDADNAQFKKDYPTFLRIEKAIRKEFAAVPNKSYQKGRLEFLHSCLGQFGASADKNLNKIIEYVQKAY